MSEVGLEVARPAETALAAGSGSRAGVYALGAMLESEFEDNLLLLRRGMDRLDRIIREVLVLGTDYDEPVYAGTYKDATGKEHRKKNLLLPGAEKLAFMARLVASYDVSREIGDGDRSPAVAYTVMCSLHLGDTSGPVAATGLGSANTHERKYRYRMGERSCPECGVVGSIRRSKFPPKGTPKGAGDGVPKPWWCMECKSEMPHDDKRILEQHVGMVPNPDPYDLDNTVLKMAKTRAYRDAVKQATGGSARLTQDVEERAVVGAIESERSGSVPVEVKPEAPRVRQELVDRLFQASKARGMTKMADVFDALRIHGEDRSRPVYHMDDVTTATIEMTLKAWDEIDGAVAAQFVSDLEAEVKP